MSTEVRPRNVIVLSSASGGTGLSTTAAMLAWTFVLRGRSCALVDLDLSGGGLDVLLGIENESGPCLQDLDAPLGTIDGGALVGELPSWEGVHVLAYAPWKGDPPAHWESTAAVDALSEANDVVLVDAGRGEVFMTVPGLLQARQLIMAELSVLGLARAGAHVAALRKAGAGTAVVLCAQPRGAPPRSGAVAMAEATAYLGGEPFGPLATDRRLCADVLDGLGIRAVPRRHRAVLEALAGELDPTADRRDGPVGGDSGR